MDERAKHNVNYFQSWQYYMNLHLGPIPPCAVPEQQSYLRNDKWATNVNTSIIGRNLFRYKDPPRERHSWTLYNVSTPFLTPLLRERESVCNGCVFANAVYIKLVSWLHWCLLETTKQTQFVFKDFISCFKYTLTNQPRRTNTRLVLY